MKKTSRNWCLQRELGLRGMDFIFTSDDRHREATDDGSLAFLKHHVLYQVLKLPVEKAKGLDGSSTSWTDCSYRHQARGGGRPFPKLGREIGYTEVLASFTLEGTLFIWFFCPLLAGLGEGKDCLPRVYYVRMGSATTRSGHGSCKWDRNSRKCSKHWQLW